MTFLGGNLKKIILKIMISVIIPVLIYFICISLFVYPCITKGMSMFPTIAPHEVKLTNRWKVITKQDFKRGDIIVIEKPDILYVSVEDYDENHLFAFYSNHFNINIFRERLMKRIIGLPNDHIQITEDNELYINGERSGYATKSNYMYIDLIVPENSVYVMGDNRRESIDSRSFGCVPIDKVYSIVF